MLSAVTLTDEFYKKVDQLKPEELDALPQGAIQLDERGTIIKFNAYEGQLSGLTPRRVIGKNFFTEVAPCTDVAEFRGRFEAGVQAKKLHEKFRYHFAFQKMPPRNVIVTLFYSDRSQSVWVLVQPQ